MSDRELHDEMRDEIAALALGALAEDEARRVREHLAGCPDCDAYARWLRPAIDQLPASVSQLEPPERLGVRLAEIARADAERLRTAEEAERAPRRRSWHGLAWRPATALAAVAVLALGGVAGWALRDPGTETEVIAAQATGDKLVEAELHRGAEGATLEVETAPRLRRESVYQLWVERAGRVEPSTTFVLDRENSGSAVVDQSLEGAEAVLVTAEPRGGSRQPTSPPLLRAPLDS